jgi:hypothetical protein
MMNHSLKTDLAGPRYARPNYFQNRRRIRYLVDYYLSFEELHERLEDLPTQFKCPQTRTWKKIQWQAINSSQVIQIELNTFLSILSGAIDTEAPIHAYAQVSRQYLEKFHTPLAHFVGGRVAPDGTSLELGLWEKEERQHTPALAKIYFQLTGKKITAKLRSVRAYQPSTNIDKDLFRHGLHRVVTEYSAVCLYIWLMAHTTGILQQVFAELVQDEINHMTKFLGFGLWAFSGPHLRYKIFQSDQGFHLKNIPRLIYTFNRMMDVLHWSSWSAGNKIELIFTFAYTLYRLMLWSKRLSPAYLEKLLGKSPLSELV